MNAIRSLTIADLSSVKSLLSLLELPVDDLNTAPVEFFGIKQGDKLIAVGALEIYSTSALLRSIAVHPNYQHLNYGTQLVQFLENKARKIGINQLYLLTTTAENFFIKLNYQSVKRELCPVEIRSSDEFKIICPSAANSLFKNL